MMSIDYDLLLNGVVLYILVTLNQGAHVKLTQPLIMVLGGQYNPTITQII